MVWMLIFTKVLHFHHFPSNLGLSNIFFKYLKLYFIYVFFSCSCCNQINVISLHVIQLCSPHRQANRAAVSSIVLQCQNWPGARQRNPGPWRRCHKEAGVSRLSERWSTRLPESMTLPKGEKHHFIIQCDSHPLSLSNMPYVPVTGRLAGLSSVTGLFTHCSQSDTISCRKKSPP